MKLAVIPEPSAAVIAAVRRVAPDAVVFAPWALPQWAGRGPAPLERFVRRRSLPGARFIVGWPLLEASLRLWQRGKTDRRYRALFAVRQWVSMASARFIARRSDIDTVLAPSLAAREIFAATNAGKILIEDLPGLRALHADLELASAAHPGCRFLRRFRASAKTVVRQESEWILADSIVVRGRHGAARHQSRDPIALPEAVGAATGIGVGRSVALAGLATARNGSNEALAMLEALPDIRLLIRKGEGAEPRELLEHPRVEARQAGDFGDAAAVIAPSWVEAYPGELVAAASRGLAIIATERASSHIDPRCVTTVAVGDAEALTAEVADTLREARLSHASG